MNEVAQTQVVTKKTRELVDLLEEMREQQGVSKVELAERIGVHVVSLRATLHHRGGEPALSRLIAIAEALGCTLNIGLEKIE